MRDRFPYLGGDQVLAIAHRGGDGRHPENTLEAFQDAIDLGFRHIETDVHASADGTLYAFHDDRLGRVAGVDAAIGELTSGEVDAIRFGQQKCRIPRLDELLSTWPLVNVNIDPKSDGAVGPLVATLARHGAVSRVCVGSFSDRRIRYCRNELGADLCTSMGPIEIGRLLARAQGLPTRDFEAAVAQIPISYRVAGIGITVTSERLVETAHRLNIDVHVWTIDEPGEIGELLNLGVDGIMTDRPDVLRSVLIDRDEWEADDG